MLSLGLAVILLLICLCLLILFYLICFRLGLGLFRPFQGCLLSNRNLQNLLMPGYRCPVENLSYHYWVFRVECGQFYHFRQYLYFFFSFLAYFESFLLLRTAMSYISSYDLMLVIQNPICFPFFRGQKGHFQLKYVYVYFLYSYKNYRIEQLEILKFINKEITYVNQFYLSLRDCCLFIQLLRIYNHYLMRYSLSIFKQAISQWRDCYIHYEYLKLFIVAIQKIMGEVNELEEKVDDHENPDKNNQQYNKLSVNQVILFNDAIYKLKLIVLQIDELYMKAFLGQVLICEMFCLLKFNEIRKRYKMSMSYYQVCDINRKQSVLKPFTQYIYIQAVYLTKMIQSNQQAQRKTLKKLKKYSHGVVEAHEAQLTPFLKSHAKKVNKVVDQIQNFYIELCQNIDKERKKKKQKPKKKRDYLRNLAQRPETTNRDSFIFGLWVGLFVAVITFMSLLIVYKNKSVQTDPIFNRDFATWRGIAFIILYVWVIGMNVYYFEQYKISHDIILDFNQHHHLNSTQIFKIAGVFSTIFSALFTVYALQLSDIVVFYNFPSKYLVLFIWGIMILFMINPFPTKYHKSRFFVLKTLAKIVISPCVGVTFLIAWSTDQLLSLITPFQDLTYTICYYTYLDFSDVEVKNNLCKNPARIAVFVYSAIILSYRIFQCLRQGYDKKKYWRQFQFYNTLKYLASLLTLVLSFLWKSGNQSIFAAWLTFTIVSTIYSYAWDLKVDWDLLHKNAPHCLLRQTIYYAPYIYYIVIVGNLILRLAWTLTLSPNIAIKTFGSAEIFRLVTGALEIFRRGMWNLLRIQKQHLKNCQQLVALHKIYYRLQKRIQQQLKNEYKPRSQTAQRLAPVQLINSQQQISNQIQDNTSEDTQIAQPQLKPLKQQLKSHEMLQIDLQSGLTMKQLQANRIISQIKHQKEQ